MAADSRASASGSTLRLPLEAMGRVDRICDQFDGAWRTGQRPRLEDYLAEEAEETRPVLFRELLATEVERRLRLGELLTLDEYLERFPERAAAVGAVLTELGLARGGRPQPGASLQAPAFADDTVRADAKDAEPSSILFPPLPTIPGYEVLGELGRGGMGVVYQAREVRLNRIVALKMILAGVHASPEAALRFLNEAEVVARLRHPNIVQIFAMGDHEGRPFVELEYVEGGNLARSIDGTPRPAPGAAGLIELLARAVHEAHRRGIVHRDLKPANVLLTPDGAPKVADFGLAKAIGCESGLTHSDFVMGTPSYMAPEQAEGHVKSVGVAADVYALGAIFYELLTGRPPFRAATGLATLELVRTVDPVPPARFQPNLPRDAETICLKCLEKDPAKRYPTAEALAEDLRRYIDGRPIAARPVGPAGRFWRWCLREPRVAVLLLLLALTFTSGFAAVAWALHRARTEAALARTERNSAVAARATAESNYKRAEANFLKARAAVESLTQISQKLAGRPELEKARRELLEKVVEFHLNLLAEKSDDAALIEQSAKALEAVAHIRGDLGQDDRAAEACKRSEELYERLVTLEPAKPEYRLALAWAHFWTGRQQAKNGSNYPAAQASYEKAIELTKGLLEESPRSVSHGSALAVFLINWAAARKGVGERAEAERALGEAIALDRQILVTAPRNEVVRRDLALALDDYSALLLSSGRNDQAETASREAVSLLQGVVTARKGVDWLHSYLARFQSKLAAVLQAKGLNGEAESWHQKAYLGLKTLIATFPEVVDYRLQLGTTALQYARLIDAEGRHDEAGPVFRVTVAQHKKLADDFPENAAYLNSYAWDLATIPDATLRDPKRAVRIATKAVALVPGDANFWNTLGVAHYRADDFASARTVLEKSIQVRKNGDFIDDWLFLAMSCWKLGDKTSARQWYNKVVEHTGAENIVDDETRGFRAEADALLAGPGQK